MMRCVEVWRWWGQRRLYGTPVFPLGNAELRLSTLEDTRGVLRLVGRDVLAFLQGILTNDIHHLEPKTGSSIYTALLTPKGRIAHDLFIYHDAESPGKTSVLVDSDRRSMTDLIHQLKTYRLRSDVDIQDISTNHRVCCLFGDPAITDAHRLDPRLSSLGYRFVTPIQAIPHDSLTDAAIYKSWRVIHGVAEGRSEIPIEALPLEYNLDGLNGVSFSKGCYVGQELTARTHFQGVIRKRLFPATLSQPTSFAVEGAEIRFDPEFKKVGEIRDVSGNHVLAFLRVQPATDAIKRVEGRCLVLAAAPEVELHPTYPSWWPSAWHQP